MHDNLKSTNIQYTGPLTLNARSIQQAYYTLFNRDSDWNNLTGREMTISELSNLLSFIEACVMTDRIYFDGTIPPDDVEKTINYIGQLKREIGANKLTTKNKINISSIKSKNERDLLCVCKESVEQASELIRNLNPKEILRNNIDEPVKGEISNFIKAINKNYKNFNSRKQESLNILSNIILRKMTFRGSKCVAGILVSECEDYDLLDIVKEKFKLCSNEKQQRYLIAALINRFRTNFINAQASKKKAAYLANPDIESLRNQQVVLLWKYLFRKLKESYQNKMSDDLNKLFRGEYKSFPIGFIVLMRTRSRNPFDLFETAFKIKEPIFNKIVTKKTPQKRFFHDFDKNEFQDLEEELLSNLYFEIDTGEKKDVPKYYNIINYLIPVIIGAAAASAYSFFIKEFDIQSIIAAKEITTSTSALIMKSSLKLMQPNRRYNIYLDNYQKLKDFYSKAVTNEKVGRSLSEQVNFIFKRKLTL